MKSIRPLHYLLPLMLGCSLLAVPAEINYQGRLTDSDGNPASGTKTFSLKLFDAASGGKEIYSEIIGSVAVDNNGIYNFRFGAGGSSTVATSETIATTDGSTQVFNATLTELPINGSVILSDGTYTWSQSSGSSHPSDFTGSATPATGAVSAIYLSGAPASGTDITASYDYSETGISGALTSADNHWIELSINGDIQTPRERVLSVPFAQVAGRALIAESALSVTAPNVYDKTVILNPWTGGQLPRTGTFDPTDTVTPWVYYLEPNHDHRAISQVSVRMKEEIQSTISPGSTAYAFGDLGLYRRSDGGSEVRLTYVKTTNNLNYITFTVNERIELDWENYTYYLKLNLGFDGAYSGYNPPKGGATIQWVRVTYQYAE